MSILCKYCTVHYVCCTVHYSGTLCHYYVNTVQYITYSVNTVQYITVVHYLLRKYCTVLTSVDSNDILYNSMHFLLSNANNDAIMEHTRADNSDKYIMNPHSPIKTRNTVHYCCTLCH